MRLNSPPKPKPKPLIPIPGAEEGGGAGGGDEGIDKAGHLFVEEGEVGGIGEVLRGAAERHQVARHRVHADTRPFLRLFRDLE